MHRHFIIISAVVVAYTVSVSAITLKQASDQQQPGLYNYDVLFTNPKCKEYEYEVSVSSENGEALETKPKGAWCERSDSRASGRRPSSPQNRLISLINSAETKEIFMTFLSISNKAVVEALVENIESRDLKVTFIFDHPLFDGQRRNHPVSRSLMRRSRQPLTASDLEDPEFFQQIFMSINPNYDRRNPDDDIPQWISNPKAKRPLQILRARPSDRDKQPVLHLRGHKGSSLIYAHNKLVIINPNSPDKMTFAFSSGNLSSGVVLHHENWHFVTLSPKTYFAQAHLCLMNGMIDHGLTARNYKRYISRCRADINYPEEEDIKTYFVPGEGEKAFTQVKAMISGARSIDMAAHRFIYSDMVDFLESKIKNDGLKFHLIVDDDMYWAYHEYCGRGCEPPRKYPNTGSEFIKVQRLIDAGRDSGSDLVDRARVQFMQTNHWDRFLHHNKFILARDNEDEVKSVFCGAGNFTKSAFTVNYENFYFITIPEVREAFHRQYSYLWKISSQEGEMPQRNIKPNGEDD